MVRINLRRSVDMMAGRVSKSIAALAFSRLPHLNTYHYTRNLFLVGMKYCPTKDRISKISPLCTSAGSINISSWAEPSNRWYMLPTDHVPAWGLVRRMDSERVHNPASCRIQNRRSPLFW